MEFLKWWLALGQEPEPVDPSAWHKWRVFWPMRDCETGRFLTSYVWRRRHNGRWEYKHRELSAEEFADRF